MKLWPFVVVLVGWQVVNSGGRLTGVGHTVTITVPTSSATYDAGTSSTLTISGTALSDRTVTSCIYSNSLGGSGSATGGASWSIASLALTEGSNVITVTCTNNAGTTGQDVITVTRSSGSVSGNTPHPSTACVAVGPTSSGTADGSSWTNRRAGIPAGSAIARNTTYYLMDGAYGTYAFSEAESGTSRVYIYKAQSYDFGRSADNCTNDISAGWVEASMGSSQATFTGLETSSNNGYITWWGNGRSTMACGNSPTAGGFGAKDCGIKITTDNQEMGTHSSGSARINGFTMGYTEIDGPGDVASVTEGFFIWFRDGCNDCIVENTWWYESQCVYLKVPWSTGFIVRNSHHRQNFSQSSCHGQWWEAEVQNSAIDIYDNVFQDIATAGSTGFMVWITGADVDDVDIYGNVFFSTSGSSRAGASNGMLACINGGTVCTNIRFYNNTIINLQDSTGIKDENGGGTYIWKNNIFYNSDTPGFNFTVGTTTITCTHNTWLNSGTPGSGCNTGGASANILVTSGATDYFVAWVTLNFHLNQDHANINAGTDVGSPYNIDPDGVTRGADGTWDRGAFDF